MSHSLPIQKHRQCKERNLTRQPTGRARAAVLCKGHRPRAGGFYVKRHMAHCKCQHCGNVATDQEWLSTPNAACPKCGHKHFTMTFQSTLQFLQCGATKIRQRDPHHKSARKLRREHFQGPDLNKDGKVMLKERLIDKDANYYFERVVDPETGETTRLCEEKLTDHVERGSAKKRKNSDA